MNERGIKNCGGNFQNDFSSKIAKGTKVSEPESI
jgi:hypothetical protein